METKAAQFDRGALTSDLLKAGLCNRDGFPNSKATDTACLFATPCLAKMGAESANRQTDYKHNR